MSRGKSKLRLFTRARFILGMGTGGCIKGTTTNVAIGINGITGVGLRQGYMPDAGRGLLPDRIERFQFASQAL